MPTYEYKCEGCSYKFEAFQGITAKPLKKCPKCGEKITRLFGTGAGFIFKGPGFYATDYKKPSKNKQPKSAHPKPNSCPGQTQGCNGCDAKGA